MVGIYNGLRKTSDIRQIVVMMKKLYYTNKYNGKCRGYVTKYGKRHDGRHQADGCDDDEVVFL